jgi:tetratricopeptide (TPR) repeat protein
MRVYSTREVTELTGVSKGRIRSLVRGGILNPQRTARGHYRFSFQDLVLLRTAKELETARIGLRGAWRALRKLAAELPPGRSLSSLRIVLDGNRLLVRDRASAWEPHSGQTVLDFSMQQLQQKVAPLVRSAAAEAKSRLRSGEEWFELALELEQVGATGEAESAYREALAVEPEHANAMINLGRLRHAERKHKEAEALYRNALALDPRHAIARFNLGVVLEDQGRIQEAIANYRLANEIDPSVADVHYNLARLYEHQGDRQAAIRHLAAFKALSHERDE